MATRREWDFMSDSWYVFYPLKNHLSLIRWRQQSLFFATQAVTVFHWARISDRVGRKPVILVGLFGLTISMYCFGLSRTFAGLVISRCLSGALNGNIGVIKSMMGELTDSTNVARAFAFQPIPWSLGASLGPMIGGALAHPAERFPDLFGGNKFLERYPYFLPCAIPATFSIISWIIVFLFLKETNPTGFSVRTLFSRLFRCHRQANSSLSPESESQKVATEPNSPAPAPPIRALLTPQVILSTSTYALLSLIDIAYRALQPVFYSTPRSLGGLGLPPHAIGTILAVLGIGNGVFQVTCFARMCKRWGVRKVYLAGIVCAAPIFISFPLMSAVVHAEDAAAGRIGESLLGTEAYVPLSPTLIALIAMQICCTMMINTCYGCVFIYITAAANTIKSSPALDKATNAAPPRPPISSSSSTTTLVTSTSPSRRSPDISLERDLPPSKLVSKSSTKNPKAKSKKKGRQTLGAVNGLAQCTVSVMRCVGPYAASWLYTRGLALRYGNGAGSPPPYEPLPESPVFEDGVGPGLTSWIVSSFVDVANLGVKVSGEGDGGKEEGDGGLMRQLASVLVYVVLLVLVAFTLIVGSRLPAAPWTDEEEEKVEVEDEAEDEHEEEE